MFYINSRDKIIIIISAAVSIITVIIKIVSGILHNKTGFYYYIETATYGAGIFSITGIYLSYLFWILQVKNGGQSINDFNADLTNEVKLIEDGNVKINKNDTAMLVKFIKKMLGSD